MPLPSEQLMKIHKDHLTDLVKKKLDELGDSDEALLEYIIVMLENNKDQSEFIENLEMFMEDKTAGFVTWLWEVLASLRGNEGNKTQPNTVTASAPAATTPSKNAVPAPVPVPTSAPVSASKAAQVEDRDEIIDLKEDLTDIDLDIESRSRKVKEQSAKKATTKTPATTEKTMPTISSSDRATATTTPKKHITPAVSATAAATVTTKLIDSSGAVITKKESHDTRKSSPRIASAVVRPMAEKIPDYVPPVSARSPMKESTGQQQQQEIEALPEYEPLIKSAVVVREKPQSTKRIAPTSSARLLSTAMSQASEKNQDLKRPKLAESGFSTLNNSKAETRLNRNEETVEGFSIQPKLADGLGFRTRKQIERDALLQKSELNTSDTSISVASSDISNGLSTSDASAVAITATAPRRVIMLTTDSNTPNTSDGGSGERKVKALFTGKTRALGAHDPANTIITVRTTTDLEDVDQRTKAVGVAPVPKRTIHVVTGNTDVATTTAATLEKKMQEEDEENKQKHIARLKRFGQISTTTSSTIRTTATETKGPAEVEEISPKRKITSEPTDNPRGKVFVTKDEKGNLVIRRTKEMEAESSLPSAPASATPTRATTDSTKVIPTTTASPKTKQSFSKRVVNVPPPPRMVTASFGMNMNMGAPNPYAWQNPAYITPGFTPMNNVGMGMGIPLANPVAPSLFSAPMPSNVWIPNRNPFAASPTRIVSNQVQPQKQGQGSPKSPADVLRARLLEAKSKQQKKTDVVVLVDGSATPTKTSSSTINSSTTVSSFNFTSATESNTMEKRTTVTANTSATPSTPNKPSSSANNTDNMKTTPVKAKKPIKCSFFPNCSNGDNCEYIHPKEPCRNFPMCPAGNNCIFVHPPCKFGANCTNPACNYQHPPNKKIGFNPFFAGMNPQPMMPYVKPAPQDCRFGIRCTRVDCHFRHPPGRSIVH